MRTHRARLVTVGDHKKWAPNVTRRPRSTNGRWSTSFNSHDPSQTHSGGLFPRSNMRGSCLCKSIEYEVRQLDSPIEHCSCHTCRKAHAAAFNTAASVKHTHFRWLKGEALLKGYESSPGKTRYFCSNCGTHLVACRDGRDYLMLRVATLDDDPHAIPEFQIWASHEVPWLRYGLTVVA